MEAKSYVTQVNGVRLFCEEKGVGEPLILLHGNGEDHHIFDAIVLRLAEFYQVYAIDSRNHGQSEVTEDYSYETMARDVLAFAAEKGLVKPHILGFSDGAIIGLLMAMESVASLGRLVLLGINLKPEDFTDEALAWVSEMYEETKDPLFRMMLEQPSIALEDTARVANPVLLVAAENDIFKPESFERLAAALPNAVLRVMEGHEHDSYITGTDILFPVVRDFLEG